MKKKTKFVGPKVIDTTVFIDECGMIWSYPSRYHSVSTPAVTMLRKDYKLLLKLARKAQTAKRTP